MTIWDEIANIFKSKEQIAKEKQQAIDSAKQKEKDLFSELKKLDDEYNSTVKGYEEKDYESMFEKYDKPLKKDNTLSDEKLQEIAKKESYGSYDDVLNKIKKDYDDAVKNSDEKLNNTISKSEQNVINFNKNYKANNENINNTMSKKGLFHSSIKDNLDKVNKGDYQSKITTNKQLTDKLIEMINNDKQNYNLDKQNAVSNLDKETNKNYEDLLDKLTTKRNIDREKINDYNQNIELEKTKYNNKLQELISELKDKDRKLYLDSQRLEKENEAKYGYTGDKKVNYDKRLSLALDFYNTLPKDIALSVAKNNPTLHSYLGEYYKTLIGSINERPERKPLFG